MFLFLILEFKFQNIKNVDIIWSFFRFKPEAFPELTPDRFAELKNSFVSLDKDDFGFINSRDLKNALKFLGQTK